MNLTISATSLNAALSSVGAAIQPKDPKPILQCVRIDAQDTVEFRGTNLVVEITRRCEAEIARQGVLCVAHARLAAWCSMLPKTATVEIDAKDDAITCKAGRARLTLPTQDAGDFPKFAALTNPAIFEIDAAKFMARLGSAVPFLGEPRMGADYLCGVHVATNGSDLRYGATNIKIVLRVSDEAPSGAKDLPVKGILLSEMAIKAARGSVPQDGLVTVKVSSALIAIEFTGGQFVSKLIDGEFPDLDRVVKIDRPLSVSFDAAQALAAVTRLLATRGGEEKSSRVELSVKGNEMTLTAGARGDLEGNSEDGLECTATEDFAMALHGRQFVTQLEAIGAETIELAVARDPMMPYIMRASPPNGVESVGAATR